MIEFLKKWAKANERPTRTYPHSLWLNNTCVLVGETYSDLMSQFSKYLDNAFGANKWIIEASDDTYTIHNHNRKHQFATFTYKDRNDIKVKNVVQAEVY